MRTISSWGIIALAVYLIFILSLFLYAKVCDGVYCGVVVALGAFPWIIWDDFFNRILKYFVEGSIHSGNVWWTFYTVAVLINCVILYCSFAQLQRTLKHHANLASRS